RLLGRTLSRIRAHDAQAAALSSLGLPAAAAAGRDHLRERLARHRARRLAAGEWALTRDDRLLGRLARAERLGRRPRPPARGARAPFAPLASGFLMRRLLALAAPLPAPQETSPEALEEALRPVQRLRYAWEVMRPAVAPSRFMEILLRLEEAQRAGDLAVDLLQ